MDFVGGEFLGHNICATYALLTNNVTSSGFYIH